MQCRQGVALLGKVIRNVLASFLILLCVLMLLMRCLCVLMQVWRINYSTKFAARRYYLAFSSR